MIDNIWTWLLLPGANLSHKLDERDDLGDAASSTLQKHPEQRSVSVPSAYS